MGVGTGGERAAGSRPGRLRRLGRPGRLRPQPARPPLEVLAAEARRRGRRWRTLPPGTSFCKVEAVRHAYERVLGDCADALEVPHLLGVLGPGDQRDRERDRVEGALFLRGFEVDAIA